LFMGSNGTIDWDTGLVLITTPADAIVIGLFKSNPDIKHVNRFSQTIATTPVLNFASEKFTGCNEYEEFALLVNYKGSGIYIVHGLKR